MNGDGGVYNGVHFEERCRGSSVNHTGISIVVSGISRTYNIQNIYTATYVYVSLQREKEKEGKSEGHHCQKHCFAIVSHYIHLLLLLKCSCHCLAAATCPPSDFRLSAMPSQTQHRLS